MSNLLNEMENYSVAVGSQASLQGAKDITSGNIIAENGNGKQIPERARVPVETMTTKKMEQLLAQNNLPFLPNEKGYCNVKAVKTAVSGYELTGANQLIAKAFLRERGMDNDNIITYNQAADLGSPVKVGEKAFHMSFYDKNTGKNIITRYFAEGQTRNPEILPYQKTTPESRQWPLVQESADAQDYITNYLSCVRENRAFKVSPEIAQSFKENFAAELKKGPLQIYKMGNLAEKQIYIKTEKGKEWLSSENGQKWLKTEMGKEFLKTKQGKELSEIVKVPSRDTRSIGFER